MKVQVPQRILIVEDEMVIALMIEQMIRNLGHHVVGKVATGEEAVDFAINLDPDLILMDIRLQGEMDGIEAMSEIRKKAQIPVIYITGNTDAMYKKRVEKSDHLGFLTKPITAGDLDPFFNFAS